MAWRGARAGVAAGGRVLGEKGLGRMAAGEAQRAGEASSGGLGDRRCSRTFTTFTKRTVASACSSVAGGVLG